VKPAAATPPRAPTPPPPGAKAYKVQLASFRSEADAKKAWARYAARHKDLFSGLSPDYVRAEIPGKGTYYRLQAGPLAGAAAARTLCERVKSRKLGCLVVRP
jgi:cell division septation protein DedD